MNNNNLALIVRGLHYLILIFSIFAIFGNEFWLTLHFLALPTMMFHWITNQNACSLTILEAQLTNKSMDKTFIADVLYPFFGMSDNKIIWTLCLVWWLIGAYRLKTEYNFGILKQALSNIANIFTIF